MTAELPEPWPRERYPVVHRIPTRWADNDHYGHVNNVVYYEWFDTAVNRTLIERAGCDVRELSAIGLVVESGCRFLAPVSFPEAIDVGLVVDRIGRSSVTYRLAVFRVDDEGTPVAVGRFVHVYVDRDERRTTELPAEIRRGLEPISGAAMA